MFHSSLLLLRRVLLLSLAVAVCASLSAAPSWAKAGSGGSMGSKGTKTHSSSSPGKQIEQSLIPPSSSSSSSSGSKPAGQPPAPLKAPGLAPVQSESLAPPPGTKTMPGSGMGAAPAPMAPMAPPPQPSGFFQRHPFATGLIAGAVGTGIASAMMGGEPTGGGMGPMIGGLFRYALLIGGAFLIWRLVHGLLLSRKPATPAAPPIRVQTMPSTLAPANPVEVPLSGQDLEQFGQLLVEIQTAWSLANIPRLRQLATPEMAGYLEGQLQEQRSRGLENRIEQIVLTHGHIDESWQEAELTYATVTLQWEAVDFTLRPSTGQIVAGNPQIPVQQSEVWTMVRRGHGPWVLSAIQQVRD